MVHTIRNVARAVLNFNVIGDYSESSQQQHETATTASAATSLSTTHIILANSSNNSHTKLYHTARTVS
jgi:hypothetical protein